MTSDRRGLDAGTVARMLGERIEDLARELLPGGRRDGAEYRAGSLAGEAGKSLAVRIRGAKRGVWSDFNGGIGGDALDLVAQARFGGDKGDAIRWALAWLGIGADAPPEARPVSARAAQAEAVDEEVERRRRKALAMFLEAPPGMAGTPVEAYLAGRGIHLAELGRQPAALRYHSACWCSEVRRTLPAMLGAITDGNGQHIATHRTWLQQDAEGMWRKARLRTPKKVLGASAGGMIPLQRGASGKPLRQAPEGETVAAAEGIETALSVAVSCPGLRVVAAVSLSNFARLNLPPAVRTLILCADNDDGNAMAQATLARAVEHHQAQGRQVRVARSPVGSDFNDALTLEEDA